MRQGHHREELFDSWCKGTRANNQGAVEITKEAPEAHQSSCRVDSMEMWTLRRQFGRLNLEPRGFRLESAQRLHRRQHQRIPPMLSFPLTLKSRAVLLLHWKAARSLTQRISCLLHPLFLPRRSLQPTNADFHSIDAGLSRIQHPDLSRLEELFRAWLHHHILHWSRSRPCVQGDC